MTILYHGSDALFDIVMPYGVNMGTIGEKPRWSAYYWKDLNKAIAWSLFQFIRRNSDVKIHYNVKYAKGMVDSELKDAILSLKFEDIYVYTVDVPDEEVGVGASPHIDEYTVDRGVTPIKVTTIKGSKITKGMLSRNIIFASSEYIDTYNKRYNAGHYDNLRGKEYEGLFDPKADYRRSKLQKALEAGHIEPGSDISGYTGLSAQEHTLVPVKGFSGFFVSPDYPNFAANRHGVILNMNTERTTIGSKDDRGYLRVSLWDNDTRHKKDYKAHRIVCSAFHGPCPGDIYEVGHGNDIRHDNRASNLSWVTRLDNMRRANYRKRLANGSQQLSMAWDPN